jgi:hypothetical protein
MNETGGGFSGWTRLIAFTEKSTPVFDRAIDDIQSAGRRMPGIKRHAVQTPVSVASATLCGDLRLRLPRVI